MALAEPSLPATITTSPTIPGATQPSRLLAMKARFQQRQLAEKEQRLLELYQSQQQRALARVGSSSAYGANGANSANSGGGGGGLSGLSASQLGNSLRAGKVRQLFDGRRGAGRDRSNPLQPLSDAPTQTQQGRSAPHPSTRRSQSLIRPGQVKQTSRSNYKSPPPPVNRYQDQQDHSNSNIIASEDTLPTQVFGKLVNVGSMQRSKAPGMVRSTSSTSASSTSSSTTSRTKQSSSTRTSLGSLATRTSPASTPKKSPTEVRENTSARGAVKKTPAVGGGSSLTSPLKATPIVNNRNQFGTRGSTAAKSIGDSSSNPSSSNAVKISSPSSSVNNSDLKECKICGRRFNSDRISAHEIICVKAQQKKRKIFDPVKQRVKGTDAEQFVLRPGAIAAQPKPAKKADWRKKHEEFISTIRAAKQVQDHLAKGGKLSELPPPPPMDTSDYVACPHCGRKFNEAAAERHIPVCARMQHNKPKPGASKRR